LGQLGLSDYKSSKINDRNLPVTITLYISNIIQISAGYAHSIVLHNIGQFYAFGNNWV
jgi:alpha-tubulin suppressor-like RCC1 family protein